ncbi:unnamed protein product [Sphenostylis stenocarpa]|uniref:Uncharacterized protein n=1 Tax=Sphenostylis stenocarpa TaxID=92480 RepID=A0AA86SEH7_9FABA|nr:unnamed protein product [Sphenostylis stenocarpa]
MMNSAPMPTLMAHSSHLTNDGDLLGYEDASSYRRLSEARNVAQSISSSSMHEALMEDDEQKKEA